MELYNLESKMYSQAGRVPGIWLSILLLFKMHYWCYLTCIEGGLHVRIIRVLDTSNGAHRYPAVLIMKGTIRSKSQPIKM